MKGWAKLSSQWESDELLGVVKKFRRPLIGVAGISALINLLMLAAPIFMLQVYDRVLPSRSVPTLISLFLLVVALFVFQGYFDRQRSRIMLHLGRRIEDEIGPRAFDILLRSHERGTDGQDGLQAQRDVDTLREFIASPALVALFDLPWMILYIGICFAMHPLIGATVLVAVIVFVGLTATGEILLRRKTQEATLAHADRRRFSEVMRRNAGIVQALGLQSAMTRRWNEENDRALDRQEIGVEITSNFAALQRALRTTLQSGLLALGAWLVIHQEATAGVMLASTILAARALAPVDMLIAHWKSFIAARQSWMRLSRIFNDTPIRQERTALGAPKQNLRVTGLGLATPATGRAVLHDVSFQVEAGSALAIIGPSGSGKSSLARAVVGIWKARHGAIRLDGARIDDWPQDALSAHIGYMPQDVELFPGTVAQNIARFQTRVDHEALMSAAKAAGVHDLILRLPLAYETPVGEGGEQLSGGQRQRIGLARALYGNPFLVVLDEPNSNLDSHGEAALTAAIREVRQRQGIAIVIAHRSSALASVDKVLVLNEGRKQAFGDRDKLFPQLVQAAPAGRANAPASRAKAKPPKEGAA